MKPFTALTLLIICLCSKQLTAQKQIAPPPLRTPGTLHPLPLIYTGIDPEIYLPGDSVRTPHIRTHIVEFTSDVMVDNNFLINGLKRQGRWEGVDAIVLNDYRKMVPGTAGMIGSISGIGIKYTESINYLDTILKQKVISMYEPNGNRGKTVLLDFDWYGRILNPFNSYDVLFYADSMSFIDLNIVFNRTSDFYQYRAFDTQPVHKIVSNDTWPFKITHHIEATPGPITQLITTKGSRINLAEKSTRVKIKPVYTGDLLTGAIITTNNNKEIPLYYLHYKYDAKGRVTDERWEKLIDGKRTLWIEVENRYFETDPEFIKTLTGRTNN